MTKNILKDRICWEYVGTAQEFRKKLSFLLETDFRFNRCQLDIHHRKHSRMMQYCTFQRKTYSIDSMLIPCHLKASFIKHFLSCLTCSIGCWILATSSGTRSTSTRSTTTRSTRWTLARIISNVGRFWWSQYRDKLPITFTNWAT